MVLDFGLLNSGLFGASNAGGEGLNADAGESVRTETGRNLRTIYTDATSASVSNNSTETVLHSYQMPADTVTEQILILVSGSGKGWNSGGTASLRLYVGPPGSETLIASRSIGVSNHGQHSFNIMKKVTGENWGSVVSIEVRGKNKVAGSSDVTKYEAIMVLGY